MEGHSGRFQDFLTSDSGQRDPGRKKYGATGCSRSRDSWSRRKNPCQGQLWSRPSSTKRSRALESTSRSRGSAYAIAHRALEAGWVGNVSRHRQDVAESVPASISTNQSLVLSRRSWKGAVTTSARREHFTWRAGRTPTRRLCVGGKNGRCSLSTGISSTPGSSRVTVHPVS